MEVETCASDSSFLRVSTDYSVLQGAIVGVAEYLTRILFATIRIGYVSDCMFVKAEANMNAQNRIRHCCESGLERINPPLCKAYSVHL